jgi:mono/diheme cytochrome c family protein
MNQRQHLLAGSLLVFGLAAFHGPAGAGAQSIEWPAETAQLKPSDLPGYAKAKAQCVACHSAEYFLYQPPSAGRAYWDNMVKRMKAVFKAPVKDEDMPAIVDYLVKTYGNEQPR